MHFSQQRAALLGMIVWVAVAALAFAASQGGPQSIAEDSAAQQLWNYAVRRPEHYAAVVGQPVGRADPVFLQDAHGRWLQVGHVTGLPPHTQQRTAVGAVNARLVWYDRRRELSDFRLESYRNRGNVEEILQTMLPADKRARIREAMTEALDLHGAEIAAAFRPVIEQSLRESVPVLEEALRASVDRRRDEFQALGRRWEQELLKQQLIPLVREEVLPTVQRHVEPLAEDIGRELWNRASLWRFGWRALYDKTALPDQQLTRKEWDRFVQEDVVPVLESRTDEIVDVQKRVLVDLAKNPQVRERMGAVFQQMIEDPQLQALISEIVRESVIDNRQLHEVWTRNWKSQQARAAMQLSGERLEPVIRQIGDELFGTREGGVDPDFARVLRNQILGKDRRWIVAVPAEAARQPAATGPQQVIQIDQGRGPAQFPLVMLAASRDQE